MLRTIAALLLIIGNVLIVSATFVPWLMLTTTFGNTFGSGGLSPWTGIVGAGPQSLREPHFVGEFTLFGLLYLFLVLVSVAYSLDLLRALALHGRSPNWSVAFGFAVVILAAAGCALAQAVSGLLQDGLGLTWPYFAVRTGAGAQMALLGALGVLLGAVLARACVQPSKLPDSGEHLTAMSESEPATQ